MHNMLAFVARQAAKSGAAGSHARPIGRLARLGLAAVAGQSLYSIAGQGGRVTVRNLSILTEPGVWFLNITMLVLFVHFVGRLAAAIVSEGVARRWQLAALAGLAAALAATAVIGQLASGAVWGFPVAGLAWWFEVLMLLETIAALLLAIALGTPGCEIGVWPQLIARQRSERAMPTAGLACLVDLHLLDA